MRGIGTIRQFNDNAFERAQTEAFGKAIGALSDKEQHSKGSHTVSIQSDTLEALRADYETLRRFVVSLAENGLRGVYSVEGAAVDALQKCSATYLPKGHPDRSH